MTLRDQVKSYLEAHGFVVKEQGADLLIGTRQSAVADTREFTYVWCPDARRPDQLRHAEPMLLQRFAEVHSNVPAAQKHVVLPSFEGLTTDFRSRARQEFNVQVRVPV